MLFNGQGEEGGWSLAAPELSVDQTNLEFRDLLASDSQMLGFKVSVVKDSKETLRQSHLGLNWLSGTITLLRGSFSVKSNIVRQFTAHGTYSHCSMIKSMR